MAYSANYSHVLNLRELSRGCDDSFAVGGLITFRPFCRERRMTHLSRNRRKPSSPCASRYPERVSRTAMLSVPHPRVFMKNLIMNPAQLRRSWYIFFFQLPWLPEFILRRRDWALLVRVLRNTSPPGLFSDSDLEL